jgi:L-cysteine desulfidase
MIGNLMGFLGAADAAIKALTGAAATNSFVVGGEFQLIPARISEYITGTDRCSVVTRIFYAIKLV